MLFTPNAIARRFAAMAVMLLVLIPALVVAQEKLVVEIKINGNDHVSSEAIISAIPLKTGAEFSEEAMQQAKLAIENMGYFQTGVTIGTESVGSGIRAIFNVVENPVVKEISITGNTVVTTEKLKSLLLTAVGTVLNTQTLLQKDVRAIEALYEEQGYIAYITEDIGLDPKTGVLKIPINEVRVEKIKITGIKKTKEYVILREMRQKSGDVYNINVMHADLQHIYDLDIFDLESASSYKTEPGSDLGKVNIIIPVKEKKTGEISLGLGYSARNGLAGQVKMTENNFRGHAQKLNLLWEKNSLRGSSYEVGFMEPWLDKKNTSLSVNLYSKQMYRFSNRTLGGGSGGVNDYDERRTGGSATISRPMGLTNRGFLTLRHENVGAGFQDMVLINRRNLSQGATISSGTGRYTNDTRDSQLDPFNGGYNSLALEFGQTDFRFYTWDLPESTTYLFGNDSSGAFSKYSLDVRRYLSKGGLRKDFNEKRKRIAVRVTGGAIGGDTPFSEQYFVGGAESLRGYREDRFWGKYMILASAEYRMPLAPSLTGVVFADYGDAWGAPEHYRITPALQRAKIIDTPASPGVPEKSHYVTLPFFQPGPVLQPLIAEDETDQTFAQHESFKGNLGYGIGIRVVTPLGPLRLDYGFGDEGSRAHFSIGHAF